MSTYPVPTAIQTLCGSIDFEQPLPGSINPADLGNALSKLPRFGGHTLELYSVAQHSLAALEVARRVHARDSQLQAEALLHDAHEAYVGDVPTPLKRLLGEPYARVLAGVDRAVRTRFGLPDKMSAEVKEIDAALLVAEAEALVRDTRTALWAPTLSAILRSPTVEALVPVAREATAEQMALGPSPSRFMAALGATTAC